MYQELLYLHYPRRKIHDRTDEAARHVQKDHERSDRHVPFENEQCTHAEKYEQRKL